MGHPILCRFVQTLHVAVLSRQPHLAKSGRILGSQTRVPTDASLGAGAGQPRFGKLTDQRAFELGRRAQNL